MLVSLQTIDPVAQLVMPVKHLFGLVVQVWFGVHAPQLPLPSQTMPAPQLAPPILLPASTQVIAPVEHDVVPFLQALGLPVQALPAVHATQIPEPLQTMFVPQPVPAALLLPSAQVIVPLEHAVAPFLQTLGFDVHALPAVHAPQTPKPLQTMFVPQVVPAALFAPSTHVCAPVAQEVVPFLQTLGLPVHAAPAVQATQTPAPLHTALAPQLLPAALLPPSTQVTTPVVQDVMPFLQIVGLLAHATPGTQSPHAPLLHTRLVPHALPFGRFPVSAQTATPVTHELVPVLHAFAGWQATPAVQMPQVPLLHTMFVPHDAPLARFLPVSEQAIAGMQVCVPAWQGFAGVHARPAVHDTQLPTLHTMFVPHEVPLATFPDAVHTGAPVAHTVVAVLHGIPVMVQLAPAAQVTQAPVALQTMFVPHAVPAAAFMFLSVQTGAPVEQPSIPRWHGFAGVQTAPA